MSTSRAQYSSRIEVADLTSDMLKAGAVFEYRPDKFHTLYIKPVFNMTLTGAF